MIRRRSPFRFADRATRHRRRRRRPVSLVFRHPPQSRRAAPPLVVWAGDQISVTLAPRFTVVLQQLPRAVAVVDRPEPPVVARPSAPPLVADARWFSIAHHRWSGGPPPVGRPAERAIGHTSGALPPDRHGATRQRTVAGRPLVSRTPAASASHPGAAQPRPAARPGVLGRTGDGDPIPHLPARIETVAGRDRRGGFAVADGHRARRVITDLVAARSVPTPGRSGDRPATASARRRHVELVLGGAAGSERRREARVTPAATVYRQARSAEVATPPAPRVLEDAPATPPAIDIDQLDRELWRRFEKRARTERERHGRA
jgi:hypothetical protein